MLATGIRAQLGIKLFGDDLDALILRRVEERAGLGDQVVVPGEDAPRGSGDRHHQGEEQAQTAGQ